MRGPSVSGGKTLPLVTNDDRYATIILEKTSEDNISWLAPRRLGSQTSHGELEIRD